MTARYGANDGTSMAWLRSTTNVLPTPTPNRAAMIGNVIASSDPKAMNRMTIAATTPINSAELPCFWTACSTTGPPSSIFSPGSPARSAAVISGWAASCGRLLAMALNCTVA